MKLSRYMFGEHVLEPEHIQITDSKVILGDQEVELPTENPFAVYC